jgi:alpha-1,2-mannosyltransferase
MILREFKPELAPSAVWVAVALVVGVAGLAAARSCWRRGNEMAGVAITGLLSAELSPVAWPHHYCWLVVGLGVIVGDGTSRRRAALALLIFALFLTRLTVWAQSMINSGSLAVDPGRMLEDSFGLAALAMIVILYRIRPTTSELQAWAPPGRQGPPADSIRPTAPARAGPSPASADTGASPGPADTGPSPVQADTGPSPVPADTGPSPAAPARTMSDQG